MRLIDADALKEKGVRMYGFGDGKYVSVSNVDRQPTIDAVPVEQYNDLLENFIDFACSGVPNLSPYCMNRCVECVDSRGWCKQNECKGFNPDVRKERR